MYSLNIARRILVVIAALSLMTGGGEVAAQSMGDYTATPPFINNLVSPNIVILLDTSGSMATRAYCDLFGDNTTVESDFDTFCPKWDPTKTYSGLFHSLVCYTYNATVGIERFEWGAGKSSVSALCPTTEWDGNFLNWATTRRMDAAKIAMIGGQCAGSRAADGSCNKIGSGLDAKVTVKAIDTGIGGDGWVRTPLIDVWKNDNSKPNSTYGRVPSSVADANDKKFAIFLPNVQNGTLQGGFCTENDETRIPIDQTNDCRDDDDGDGDKTEIGGSEFTERFFKLRVARLTEQFGVIQSLGSRARFGLNVFQGNVGTKMLTPVGGRQTIDASGTTVETFNTNNAAMIDGVEEAIPDGSTPLAESLYDIARYVAQINSYQDSSNYRYPIAFSGGNSNGVAYQGTGVGSIGASEQKVLTGSESCPAGYISNACGRDPYFFGSNHTPVWASPSAQIACCKTFVILFTDGQPNGDQNIPAVLQDAGHAAHGAHCTSGDKDTTCVGHKEDWGGGSHYLDDVAYWAHTNDLRQGTIPVISEAGHDIPGTQNLTVYTFYAFGRDIGREILQTTAKLGAFEDSNGNNLPDLATEYDRVNNLTGVAGADGVPDAYFESESADDLKDRLIAAMASILQRSSAGTSVSVLASSSTGEGALYQAFFFPSLTDGLKEVKWLGYLQGLFVDAFGNVREDTNGDGKLVYTQDDIIRSRYDTATSEVKVDRFADTDGDGKADSTTPSGTVTLKDVVGIWEGGKRLANRDPATRKILTWVDTDNDARADAGEQIDFSTANSATLGPYLRAQTSPSIWTADNIINYVRGTDIAGLRDRKLTLSGTPKVWKLGDLIHSTPTVVGGPRERFDVLYGDATYTAFYAKYKDRRQVIYAGANDGMLHAFNAGFYHRGDDSTTTTVTEHGWYTRTPADNSSGPLLGDELWGFIPYELLPQLQWLADPGYGHIYYVDLKPKVTDVRIFTPDTDHPNGWGTILIGGFRMGGSCKNCTTTTGAPEMKVNVSGTDRYFYSAYFILDITNPEADPKLLWSFAANELGLTTSYPTVARVSPLSDARTDNTNAKWVVVVGSGPTGYGAGSGQEGRLYALEMPKPYVAGSALTATEFVSGDSNSFMGDLVALDANLDYRTDTVYMGNVIDNGASPAWAGKLRRLTMGTTATFGGQTTVANWGYGTKPTTLLGDFACSPTPCTGTTKVGPIASAPAVTADDANKLWVFFGTGRYYSSADKANSDLQHFFGVKDPVVTGTCTQTSDTSCQRNDLVNVSSATVCVVCASGTDEVTGVTGATTLTALQGLIAGKDGWYTTLPTSGERNLAAPVLLGGIVFFPTYVPDTNVCTATGTGYLYALFYLSGSAYKESVIGTYASGSNTNVKRSTSMGSGMASQVAVHIGRMDTDSATGVSGNAKVCSQSSTGALACSKVKPPLASWSRYLSWIHQYQ